MIDIKQCPVCSSNKSELFLSSRDYFFCQKEFSIYRCSNCGLKFTNPRPADIELGDYYKSEEYISHSNTSKSLIAFMYKIVRTFTLGQKERYIRKFVSRGTILDFGCGTGHFLHYCKSKGWKGLGYEPDQSAAEFARSRGLTVYSNDSGLLFDNQKFDIITLWHVLEHLPDLKGTISSLAKSLQTNGFLIVAVPNPESYDAKIYEKYWAAYDLPRHLYHFNSSNLKQLFKEFNFELMQTKAMYFDSFYVSMLSEKYKNGKSNIIRAFWNGLLSNIKASRSGEYSSRIYVLRKIN